MNTNDTTPAAAQFATPESRGQYRELVSGAIGAAGDLVDSVHSQLSQSVLAAHQSASDLTSRIHSGLVQYVADRSATARSGVQLVSGQIHDQIQARISQAGSYTNVIGNQVSQLQTNAISNPPVTCWRVLCCPNGGLSVVAFTESIGSPHYCGDPSVTRLPYNGMDCAVIGGTYDNPQDAIAFMATVPPSVCSSGNNGGPPPPGNWYVCCCPPTTNPPPPCTVDVTVVATLIWPDSPPTDLDLYVADDTDGTVCYYGRLAAAEFSLNHDANPDCDTNPLPPEVIAGRLTKPHKLRVWWNNFKPDCSSGTPIPRTLVNVTNNAVADVTVNGVQIQQNEAWSSSIPEDNASGNQAGYGGGLAIDIECPSTSVNIRGQCNGVDITQTPGNDTNCIAGPFTDQISAQNWVAANQAYIAAQCQGGGGGGGGGTCPVCPPPPVCPTCPTCCNSPCNCSPQITVNVQGGSTTTTTTNVSNVTNNTTVNNIRDTVNNIRNVLNNLTTNNIDNSVSTINNYLDTVVNNLGGIVNVGNSGSAVATGHLTIDSDNRWTYELGPLDERNAQLSAWLQENVDRITKAWVTETGEGDSEAFVGNDSLDITDSFSNVT